MQQNFDTLAVFGSATSFGKAVVRELAASGKYNIRAIYTYPKEKDALEEFRNTQHVQLMDVDVRNKAAVAKAIQGTYGVWMGQSHHLTREAAIEMEVAQHVIDGIKEAGGSVRLLIYQSVGAADKHATEQWWQVKLQIENKIKEAAIPALILRPAFFVDNFSRILKDDVTKKGELRLPLPADKPVQMVSYRDIARISRIAFEKPNEWKDKTLELAGDAITMNEVCNVLGQKLGKSIKFTSIPKDEITKSFGHCPQFVSFDYAADVENLKKTIPFQMMTFKEWVHTTPLA